MSQGKTAFDLRNLAVATAGFAAFVNLYSPQALLPELAREFHVGAGEISSLMTAGTAAIAISAPFTGALADVIGRKRLISAAMFAVAVPTLIMTFMSSVPEMAFWRFVQGLLLPPIFTVTVAYIGDEWPPNEVARAAGLYVSGASIGGFSGRFIPGILADLIGWRTAIQVVALITLAAAVIVTLTLPREAEIRALGRLVVVLHRRCCGISATAGWLRLLPSASACCSTSSPPSPISASTSPRRPICSRRRCSACCSSPICVSSPFLPWTGRAIAIFGRRRFVLGTIAVWIVGALLLLAEPVAIILTGLTLCAVCGMFCQTISTGYVTMTAKEGRSSAVGLYAAIFYIGGSAGAFLTGLAWNAAGWNGCVALIVAMQIVIAAIVAAAWD